MDVKLTDGDIAVQPDGSPIYISSFDETVQRVRIACCVRKGSFACDSSLGCEADTSVLSGENAETAEKTLEMLYREATMNIENISLDVLAVVQRGGESFAQIRVTSGTQSETIEVKINGQL